MLTNPNTLMLTMAAILFVIGAITIGIGIYIMTSQALSKHVQVIANQTTKLAQKGITDDITGLVGNARSLIDALNDLVKTTAGVGIFLLLLGIALLGSAYALVLQIR